MFLGGEAPLPGEYRFLELESAGSGASGPTTSASASSSRWTARARAASAPSPALVDAAPFTVNIDHHHDNPRFGDVNLVVADASSTGEVLATSSASSASS